MRILQPLTACKSRIEMIRVVLLTRKVLTRLWPVLALTKIWTIEILIVLKTLHVLSCLVLSKLLVVGGIVAWLLLRIVCIWSKLSVLVRHLRLVWTLSRGSISPRIIILTHRS